MGLEYLHGNYPDSFNDSFPRLHDGITTSLATLIGGLNLVCPESANLESDLSASVKCETYPAFMDKAVLAR